MNVTRPTTALASLAALAVPLVLASSTPARPEAASPLVDASLGGARGDMLIPLADTRRLPADTLAPPADHHMHVWSPDAVEMLIRAQEAIGEEVIAADEARPLAAENAIAALDSAGIRRGVILSTAYFFGFPDVEVDDEAAHVRAENDYVAREAARYPERLTAFFSVNPLTDYALDEIERCAEKPEFTGLKLHLGNSNVDLGDPTHVDRLREIFGRSDRLGLQVVIHLKNPRADYGRAAVETFVEEVLPAAPDAWVQVAHLAGDGGFDEATGEAVAAFAEALDERPDLTRHLVFDYSATPIPTALARGDSTLLEQVREMNAGVLSALRQIPSDRLIYGTDWPAVSAPAYLGIRSSLDVGREELRAILETPAPYLPR